MTKINPWDADFWGDNPREKFETIANLAYISVALSLLSLILHYIGHGWVYGEYVEFYEFSFLYYLLNLFLGYDFLHEYAQMYLELESYHIPTWHYFSVLSFPIVHGLLLIYFFKEDSVESNLKIPLDLKKPLSFFFTILVIKDLIFSFNNFAEWYDGVSVSILLVMLSEIVFKLFLLLFTLRIIGITHPDTSKFLPVVFFVVFTHLFVSFYLNILDESSWNFWKSEDVSSSYKLYALLQFITLPLFWYSITCLYIYRDKDESWGEQSTPHSTLKHSEVPESTSGWDEKEEYIRRDETETEPPEDSEVEADTSMGILEKLIERRNVGEVTSEEFEEMKKEILERKPQYSKEPVDVQEEDHGDDMVKEENPMLHHFKDSVISKSNIGAGGKSKAEQIKEIKELLDSGAIDKDDYEKMKREIVG